MLFIAELGINHGGDITLAKGMISEAFKAGADIAKFQMYDPLKILGKDSPYLAEATKAQFTKAQHKDLKGYCDLWGIEYCCSVFHAEDVPFFESIGMKRYKIASRSTGDKALLAAIKATNKPLIVSNGMDKDLSLVKEIFAPRASLSVLECIAEYPTPIAKMAAVYDFEIFSETGHGLSSHCPSIVPSLTAIMYGAQIIEQHVRFDWQKEGCDISSSITFQQLKTLIEVANAELK